MRTMYGVNERVYTDNEGRYTVWHNRKGYFETIEEAQETAKAVKPNWSTGEWQIVARTIDEATFTVEDKVIEEYRN